MPSVGDRLATFIISVFKGPALDAFKELALGTADERALNRIAGDAVLRTVEIALGPDATPSEVERACLFLEEVFTPASFVGRETLRGTSVLTSMQDVLGNQLARLYEHVGPDGLSAADAIGIRSTLAELVQQLLQELVLLIAIDAPPDAHLLYALRQEWVLAMEPVMSQGEGTPLAVRYIMCRSFDTLADLCAQRFECLPIREPLIVENAVLGFWRALVAANGGPQRSEELQGQVFETALEYLEAHPSARLTQPADQLPYFSTVRGCEFDEVNWIGSEDPISRILIEAGCHRDHVALCVGHHELCGEEVFSEKFLLRPVWGLFLEMAVASNSPVLLVGLSSDAAQARSWPTVGQSSEHEEFLTLPRLPLMPGQSVVIPIATLIPRLPLPPEHTLHLALQEVSGVSYEELKRVFAPRELELELCGPALIPTNATAEVAGQRIEIRLRQFDPAATYAIDRTFMIGSCPHVFVTDGRGEATYVGSIFSAASGRRQSARLDLPTRSRLLVIAELEPETTFLERVRVGKHTLVTNAWLRRGQSLVLRLPKGAVEVSFDGFYVAEAEAAKAGLASARNALVRDYLATCRSDLLPHPLDH